MTPKEKPKEEPKEMKEGIMTRSCMKIWKLNRLLAYCIVVMINMEYGTLLDIIVRQECIPGEIYAIESGMTERFGNMNDLKVMKCEEAINR